MNVGLYNVNNKDTLSIVQELHILTSKSAKFCSKIGKILFFFACALNHCPNWIEEANSKRLVLFLSSKHNSVPRRSISGKVKYYN